MKTSFVQTIVHFLILSRWKKWIIPVICSLPYFGSLIWLLIRQQYWIFQIMLSPLVMIILVCGLGIFLANIEFRR